MLTFSEFSILTTRRLFNVIHDIKYSIFKKVVFRDCLQMRSEIYGGYRDYLSDLKLNTFVVKIFSLVTYIHT